MFACPHAGGEAKAMSAGQVSPCSWAQLPGLEGPPPAITWSSQLGGESGLVLRLRQEASHWAPGTALNLFNLSSALQLGQGGQSRAPIHPCPPLLQPTTGAPIV